MLVKRRRTIAGVIIAAALIALIGTTANGGGDHEPMDFAQQVKLLKTDNPNLTTVFPHHNRVAPTAGQTTVSDVQAAIDSMGVDQKVTQPPLAQVVSFP